MQEIIQQKQTTIEQLQQEYRPILTASDWDLSTTNDPNKRKMTLYIDNVGNGTAYHFKSTICATPYTASQTISIYNVAPNDNPIYPHEKKPTTIPLTLTSNDMWIMYCELNYNDFMGKPYHEEYYWYIIIDESNNTFSLVNMSAEAQQAFKQVVDKYLGR